MMRKKKVSRSFSVQWMEQKWKSTKEGSGILKNLLSSFPKAEDFDVNKNITKKASPCQTSSSSSKKRKEKSVPEKLALGNLVLTNSGVSYLPLESPGLDELSPRLPPFSPRAAQAAEAVVKEKASTSEEKTVAEPQRPPRYIDTAVTERRKKHRKHTDHTPTPRKHEVIPRFYFPRGKPTPRSEVESTLKQVAVLFSQQSKHGKITEEDLGPILKACDLPCYWKRIVFRAAGGGKDFLTFQEFASWWKRMCESCHDEASRFIHTLVGPNGISASKEAFDPLVQDIVDTFPGLYFLREAPEFHSRYVQTVIARIFFTVNRSWSGRITAQELRKSNFLQVVRSLEDTEDINTVQDYFSYEHFYVIYCKFWEIDRDHDLIIDKADLARHEGGAISARVIDRVFSGAVNRGFSAGNDRMTYADFVSFLIAEEDKKHQTSVEYWFRCLDVDGDGVLSMYELQYFYEEVERRMEALSIEPMSFNDVLCQLLDVVRPREEGKVRLGDLKRSRMTGNFFNAFINIHKYYEQESESSERPSIKSESGEEMSDWDRFCAEEYELLMQEEQAAQDTEINCDDSDPELDQLSRSAPESDSRPGSMLLNAL